jgi:hypothetical protein
MKKLLVGLSVVLLLQGCASVAVVKKYWPRSHDPVMFDNLVALDTEINIVNCEKPEWAKAITLSGHLSKYTEWRQDPQKDNILGLHKHLEKMGQGGSKVFCELGKKTASQRINATKSAWESR